MMDIAARQWSALALDATAPDLAAKLLPIAPSGQPVGPISPYYVGRYGFADDCLVLPFSGDNPCSLIGLGLVAPGQVALSLGTSDTLFACMDQPRTSAAGEGAVFASPDGTHYMALTCYLNGSLAREAVRDQYGMNWDQFTSALRATPPGNNGALMLPYFAPEIVPKVPRPQRRPPKPRPHRRTGQCPRRHRGPSPFLAHPRALDGRRNFLALRHRRRFGQRRNPARLRQRPQLPGPPLRDNQFSGPRRCLARRPRSPILSRPRAFVGGSRRAIRAAGRRINHRTRAKSRSRVRRTHRPVRRFRTSAHLGRSTTQKRSSYMLGPLASKMGTENAMLTERVCY